MTGTCPRGLIATGLIVFSTVWTGNAQSARDTLHDSQKGPKLVNTCLVTKDVKELAGFYKSVLEQDAQWSGDDYAEFHTGIGVLAIFSEKAQGANIPGAAIAANNKGVILEFKVADVDGEYRRLQDVVKVWVKPPSTQALGNPIRLLSRSGREPG